MKNQKNNLSFREVIRRKSVSRWENEGGATPQGHIVHDKKSWKYSKESKYDEHIKE